MSIVKNFELVFVAAVIIAMGVSNVISAPTHGAVSASSAAPAVKTVAAVDASQAPMAVVYVVGKREGAAHKAAGSHN